MASAKAVKKKPRRFYMVCRDPEEVKYNNPKSVLYSVEAAKKHAEGLCKDTNATYFILTPIMKVEPTSPPVEWTVME